MTRTTYSPPPNADAAVSLHQVTKRYGDGPAAVTAIDRQSIAFPRHRFTAVMGPSGSGKSSLLNCAAGLDHPDSGSVRIDGVDLTGMTETALTRLRRDRVGFVFQSLNLLPMLTVEQNVTLPGELAGRRPDRTAVRGLLAQLGLATMLGRLPAELSGGQQQRVAIARAMIARPAVIFADEPTGALDVRAAADVMRILRAAVSEQQQTVVLVTHDPVAAGYADDVIFMADGRIIDVLSRPTAETVAAWLAALRPAPAGAR